MSFVPSKSSYMDEMRRFAIRVTLNCYNPAIRFISFVLRRVEKGMPPPPSSSVAEESTDGGVNDGDNNNVVVEGAAAATAAAMAMQGA